MDASSAPRLPPELLIQVASQCTRILSDQQLWFALSRVSRLFRACVERYVTTDSEDRRALCLKPEAAWRGNERPVTIHCMGDEQRSFSAYAFRCISPADSRHAVFLCEALHGSFDDPEELRKSLGRSLGDSAEAPFKFTATTFELRSPGDQRASRSASVDIGKPVRVELLDLPSQSGRGTIALSFDWRKMWSVKCAPLRRLEEHRERRKGKPTRKQPLGKDAKDFLARESKAQKARERKNAPARASSRARRQPARLG